MEQPKSKSESKMLTVRQLAKKLNRSRMDVFQWVYRGKIPYHVVKLSRTGCKTYGFDMDEIDLWLALRKCKNKNQIVNKVLQEETA